MKVFSKFAVENAGAELFGTATAEELKNGIQRLLELQGFALDRVKSLGMTPQEIDTIDRYRKEISILVEQVASLLRKNAT